MVFPSARSNGPTPGVVICPGGGYSGQATAKEGFEVARRFSDAGITAFVLRYRLPNGEPPPAGTLPVPQQDVLRAIQLVRTRAAEWNVDPKRVGIVGFSAGGHLAATAATMYGQADTLPLKDSIARTPARPDFAVLIYPVIRMDLPVTHPARGPG
jgi:acetyl esterase/lipase